MLAHELCAEQPPQQAERGVGHAVGAALPRLGVVVEHTAADVVDDAVEVIRHHETAGYFNIRAEDLEQGSGEHVVGVELAAWVKPFAGIFIGVLLILSCILLHTV